MPYFFHATIYFSLMPCHFDVDYVYHITCLSYFLERFVSGPSSNAKQALLSVPARQKFQIRVGTVHRIRRLPCGTPEIRQVACSATVTGPHLTIWFSTVPRLDVRVLHSHLFRKLGSLVLPSKDEKEGRYAVGAPFTFSSTLSYPDPSLSRTFFTPDSAFKPMRVRATYSTRLSGQENAKTRRRRRSGTDGRTWNFEHQNELSGTTPNFQKRCYVASSREPPVS